MTMSEIHLPARAARAVLLHAQGLEPAPSHAATREDVLAAIRRMEVLQIDTIHVVARSPYLVLWSRLGAYEPRWLDEQLAEGALFEYWAHEACFLPVASHALLRHRMEDANSMRWKYSADVLGARRDDAERLMVHIREHGPVRSADFARTDGRGGGWWEWKDEKRLLESLFTAGEVMVARRERFQRVYDLRERVLPGWRDVPTPSREDAVRELVLRSVRALGVARLRWVPDYFRLRGAEARAAATKLADEGRLLRVRVEEWDEEGLAHPDRLPLLERAAAGEVQATRTTILSPFDPVVWDRARALEWFGFDYRLECYTPAAKRRWGYFVLPILHRGALVGRLDAKAHRREGRFEVRALWLEPGVKATAALADDVAAALRACAAWHGTPRVEVARAEPAAMARLLATRLRG